MELDNWELTRSLITNLNLPPTYIEIQKFKIADQNAHIGFINNLL